MTSKQLQQQVSELKADIVYLRLRAKDAEERCDALEDGVSCAAQAMLRVFLPHLPDDEIARAEDVLSELEAAGFMLNSRVAVNCLAVLEHEKARRFDAAVKPERKNHD